MDLKIIKWVNYFSMVAWGQTKERSDCCLRKKKYLYLTYTPHAYGRETTSGKTNASTPTGLLVVNALELEMIMIKG